MARSSRLESGFQDRLIEELGELFPGCRIFKMDQFQGVPDILILYKDRWAFLENKKSANATKQPNQGYYARMFDRWSFSRFICPENRSEVLRDLKEHFSYQRR